MFLSTFCDACHGVAYCKPTPSLCVQLWTLLEDHARCAQHPALVQMNESLGGLLHLLILLVVDHKNPLITIRKEYDIGEWHGWSWKDPLNRDNLKIFYITVINVDFMQLFGCQSAVTQVKWSNVSVFIVTIFRFLNRNPSGASIQTEMKKA